MYGFELPTLTQTLNQIISVNAQTVLSDQQILELEIKRFKGSDARKLMITGEKYYSGEHDILKRKRMVIGQGGSLEEVQNLPNNRHVDNQYSKMVDQKVNYLVGKPLTVKTENKAYEKALKLVFNKRFHRMLKIVTEDALNGGVGWLYPYYNDQGDLVFKRFEASEILPFWGDSEHTILDAAVRIYSVEAYEGKLPKIIEKVEVYDKKGIRRFVVQNGALIPDVEYPDSTHFTVVDSKGNETGYNWEKIPLIPFKYNNNETPLIKRVKTLQDGINAVLSDFQNNLQEDARNTILVLKNYDGTNLGEFRHNLATYGAVKVKSVDGADGGVDTLTIEVNADNYKIILELLKKSLIENARGFDAKDDRLAGSPNQMNIMSMYSEIDLDANGMETEFQASFEELLFFVNSYLATTGQGNFENVEVDIIFNRDMMMNEGEIITNCKNSVGILSNKTIISQHPWTDDVSAEQDELKKEKQESIDEYMGAFAPVPAAGNIGGEGDEE